MGERGAAPLKFLMEPICEGSQEENKTGWMDRWGFGWDWDSGGVVESRSEGLFL